MIFAKEGLILGRLECRYQRFLADVVLPDGSCVTAHCTNTGTMKSCFEPQDRVLLELASNPNRKLPYTWIACEREGTWIGVETGLPNRVIFEAAQLGAIPGLADLKNVQREVRYGHENSRIDVLAEDSAGRKVYIEVKNATLKVGDQVQFPDAVSLRGQKHLRELQSVVSEGHRAVILFFVHRSDVQTFDAARHIDPVYARALEAAAKAGVEVLPLMAETLVEEHEGRFQWAYAGLHAVPWDGANL